jgi:hypothetical protein
MLIAEEQRIRNEFLEKELAKKQLSDINNIEENENYLYLEVIKNVKLKNNNKIWQDACDACYEAVKFLMEEE